MGPADVLWLNMDRPTNLMVIVSVVLLESVPDWDRVLDVVRERIIEPLPRLQPACATPRGLTGHRWEDDPDFDLDRHVHRATLSGAATTAAADAELQAYVEDHLPRPFDRSRRSGRSTSSTATGPAPPSSSASTTRSPTGSP